MMSRNSRLNQIVVMTRRWNCVFYSAGLGKTSLASGWWFDYNRSAKHPNVFPDRQKIHNEIYITI